MSNLAYIEHYTYDDYKMWDDNWELIDGVAYAMAPAPMIKHQRLSFRIAREIDNSLADCEKCEVLSEVDYKVSEDTVLKPDVVVTCGEENDYYLTRAPEIVAEVISKSTALRDEKYKFTIYESEGVKYYLLVYPNDMMVKIYKLKEGKYIKEGDYIGEKYKFTDMSCDIEIDFSNIFGQHKNG